jgi:acetyl esterase/lipase
MTEAPRPTPLTASRRALLLAAGGLNLLPGASAHASPPGPLRPPPPGTALPAAWTAAPVLALWPVARMPGDGEFLAQAAPAVLAGRTLPAVFVRGVERPTLRVFRPTRPNGGAVLVAPGGGYFMVSVVNEGLEVAQRLTALGYTAFVLTYRLPAEGWRAPADTPLQDAQRAMRVIRRDAAVYGYDPARVAAVGFSAGGHLIASLAVGADEAVYGPVDAADGLSARPAAAGLIYPVITLTKPFGEPNSRGFLLGPDAGIDAAVARRSPEQHVDGRTPPIFLAQACDDATVHVENSQMMLAACRAAKRPVEAHIFQEGGHAFGVGYDGAPCGLWIELFHRWMGRNGMA